jgi:mono/diheme cytochrome c family protein
MRCNRTDRSAQRRTLLWVLVGAIGVLVTVAGGVTLRAQAADEPTPTAQQISAGKAAFDDHCAPCHGRELVSNHQMLPGTASLALKYKGSVPPALEDRTDLTAAFVKYTVRHGTEVMPFFRKTMVSDRELDAIAAYLSRPRAASSAASGGT